MKQVAQIKPKRRANGTAPARRRKRKDVPPPVCVLDIGKRISLTLTAELYGFEVNEK